MNPIFVDGRWENADDRLRRLIALWESGDSKASRELLRERDRLGFLAGEGVRELVDLVQDSIDVSARLLQSLGASLLTVRQMALRTSRQEMPSWAAFVRGVEALSRNRSRFAPAWIYLRPEGPNEAKRYLVDVRAVLRRARSKKTIPSDFVDWVAETLPELEDGITAANELIKWSKVPDWARYAGPSKAAIDAALAKMAEQGTDFWRRKKKK